MPQGSAEKTKARRDEILRACAELTDRMTTQTLSIADIAAKTSFGRTSVYNYFQTIEEILLALLEQQYEKWAEDMEQIAREPDADDPEHYVTALAESLGRRRLLLKLLSLNLFQVEEKCRPVALRRFKEAFGKAKNALKDSLRIFWQEASEDDLEAFFYAFFPFMHGLYSYTTVTAKQAKAMDEAGVKYAVCTVEDLTSAFLRRYLGLPARPAGSDPAKGEKSLKGQQTRHEIHKTGPQ